MKRAVEAELVKILEVELAELKGKHDERAKERAAEAERVKALEVELAELKGKHDERAKERAAVRSASRLWRLSWLN